MNPPALLRRLLGFATLAFLADEFHPSLRHNKPGISSMANTGPATNGRQPFLTHVTTAHLNRKHSVFGEVAHGQEVNDGIVCGDTFTKI
jgi:peptidyl-prolyl cis-trans isomerase A (cyclophilin A)